uniref:Uncharacterized protein n=1 Tax=Oryza meridionalis TaxID=40149 RepID=A0A0E0CCS6_9ORYZ
MCSVGPVRRLGTGGGGGGAPHAIRPRQGGGVPVHRARTTRDKLARRGERHNDCTRRPTVDLKMHRDQLIGSAFIAFGIILLVGFFYAAVLTKMLPPYENWFLSAIQNDRYYCLLIPLTLPVIIVAVYLHWLSMKMFKHA